MAPMIVPVVIHEAACLTAIASAPWYDLAADYMVVLGNGVRRSEYFAPLVMFATVVHIDPSDPVLAHVLFFANVVVGHL